MALLKKNILYQSLYQVLMVILPLITAPYVARVLGADNSGIYSFTHTIANYFVVFGMLGLEQYGNRSIAKVKDDQEAMNRVFSELLVIHIIVSAVAIACYFIYCFAFSTVYRGVFLLQGLYVISTLFDVNWFFFGIELFKLTITRNTVIKILTVLATFLFVKNRDDLEIYTFILSFSMLLSQLAIWPMMGKFVKFRKVRIADLGKHWKPLSILFFAVISANLNRMIDKAMLGWFGMINDLGCYDYADRIIRMPLSLVSAFGTIMLSKMSNLFARDDHTGTRKILDISASLVLMLTIGMGFGIAAIAPEFIPLFLGKEYEGTVILLTILSVSIPLVGWNNYIRTQILIPREMDMVYTRAVTVGAGFNITINCVLIPFFGARGASLATVISYAVILIIQMIPIAKELKTGVKKTIFPLAAGSVMYSAVRISSTIADSYFGAILIELVIGGVVYGGLTLLYLWKVQPVVLHEIMRS